MELAKITTRGQITIPLAIRKKLGVKAGDKVAVFELNGRIIIESSALLALKNAQEGFRLERATDQDIANMVEDAR